MVLVPLFCRASADAKEQQCSLNETALKERKEELQRVKGLIDVEREQLALLIIHITQALEEQVCTTPALLSALVTTVRSSIARES